MQHAHVEYGAQSRECFSARHPEPFASAHAFGIEAESVEPAGARQVDGALVVKVLRNDDHLGQPEHLFGANDRIERSKPGAIEQ